jgi:uncharacterized protein YlxW (UPF0749 family)
VSFVLKFSLQSVHVNILGDPTKQKEGPDQAKRRTRPSKKKDPTKQKNEKDPTKQKNVKDLTKQKEGPNQCLNRIPI